MKKCVGLREIFEGMVCISFRLWWCCVARNDCTSARSTTDTDPMWLWDLIVVKDSMRASDTSGGQTR